MESFQWHCIILDPKMKYSWNHKSCYEQKHYICQTKLKNVNRKQKKKLRKLYNNRKLNEVPVPEITNNAISNTNSNITSKSEANTESNDINNAAFATRPKNLKKRKGKKGKGRRRNKKASQVNHSLNGTLQDAPISDTIPSNLQHTQVNVNRTAPKKLHWKTYYQGTISPFHPRGIVEEFDFQN
ncbi:hypothetical protein AMK59_3779 [Oryctes borbonicus]|uniref:C-type lectin n=1 Tax=Oryctes borbonicus TaxID=1629725 RepID=A0A0T6B6F4_9SCAR|nr:hypothetical protein AMK59_3779 [Oryctes borbonicus]